MSAGAQPISSTNCAWCGNPAVTEIEIEPAVIRNDSKTGAAKIVKRPIVAWACDAHRHITERADKVGNLNFRRTKDRHAQQTSFFDAPPDRPANAIHGDDAT